MFRNDKSKFRRSALAVALVSLGVGATWSIAGIAQDQLAARHQVQDAGTQQRSLYLIALKDPALAMYEGEKAGLAKPGKLTNGRMDVKSSAARAYVAHLADQQEQFLDAISAELGRSIAPIGPDYQFQHALNGFVVALTEAELAQVRQNEQVALVDPFRLLEQDTDLSQSFIGAYTVWAGSSTTGGVGSRGDATVVGILDSGINFTSPSFAGTDRAGYTHVNPLGAGNYLGLCQTGQVDAGNCNSKLIGAYDFVSSYCTGPTQPCNGTDFTEEPSATDNNGHGSHTASITAGNVSIASYSNNVLTIVGTAPHANIIAYDVCYLRTSTSDGFCPNFSAAAAVNQAISDGIVDVINFSIGGGTLPWSDSVSLAFLSAQNAGIFVAASAGNTRTSAPPTAGSTGHVEPWVTTVAASTHTRNGFAHRMRVTGPGSPPMGLTDIKLTTSTGGTELSATIAGTTPVVMSSGFSTTSDGCTAYTAGTFTNSIAVIKRGTCSFTIKANNAITAGAIAVVLVNNTTGSITPSLTTPVPTAPVFSITQAEGDSLNAFVTGNPGTTATIEYPAMAVPTTPDVMADFSLIGPSAYPLLKPDITGPGVAVIAAYSGAPTSVRALGGTSMSSPHIAGAAALLRSLNRTWTPTQIKTAMVSTASTTNLFKPDGTTASDPFNRGAGRIDLTKAAKAGLVMDETGANFLAANPATGGNPATLNLPSMQNLNCVGTCSFVRTVKSARLGTEWTFTATGFPTGAVTITPSTLNLGSATSATASGTFTVNVDSTLLTPGVSTFGEIVATPANTAIPTARFTMAMRGSGPDIAVSYSLPDLLVTLGATGTTQRSFTIANTGNPSIAWTLASGTQAATVLSQTTALGNGFESAQWVGATPANTGKYSAEDFDVMTNATITSLSAGGFVLPGGSNLSSSAVATALNFAVYDDLPGEPDGDPETAGSTPVWTYSLAPTATGANVTSNNIALNLVTAGAPALNLAPGRYWLTVFPTMPGNGTFSTGNPGWAWRVTGVNATPDYGNAPKVITPSDTGAVWETAAFSSAPGPGPAAGLTATINANVDCGAAYVVPDSTSGTLGLAGNNTVNLTYTSSGLSEGLHTAYICVATGSDSDEPMTLVPVGILVQETIFANSME